MKISCLLLAVCLHSVLCSSLWKKVGRSPPNTFVKLTVSLPVPEEGLVSLSKHFYAISDPTSPLWGKHLTRDSADDLVRPSILQQKAALDWLTGSCVKSNELQSGGGFVTLHASVSCAENLFGIEFSSYVHETGRIMHRYEGVPQLPHHFTSLAPSTSLSSGPTQVTRGAASTTPSTIRAAYGMGSVQGSGKAQSMVQISGFLEEYAEDSDLQEFFGHFYPEGKGRKFKVVGPNGSPSGVEAALDVQYVMSIGSNVSATFWYTDAGSAPNPYDNEPYLTWLLNVSALSDA